MEQLDLVLLELGHCLGSYVYQSQLTEGQELVQVSPLEVHHHGDGGAEVDHAEGEQSSQYYPSEVDPMDVLALFLFFLGAHIEMYAIIRIYL